jgi:hypothetical protein
MKAATKSLAMLAALICGLSAALAAKPDWDRPANIKDAAERLALLHRTQGSPGVVKFLSACYRTHTLASAFSQGLESCMAQDFMHTQVLAMIYSKVPADVRAKQKAPSPEAISGAMDERFEQAKAQYHLSDEELIDFKKLIEKDGMPVFLKAVFTKAGEGDGKGSAKPKIDRTP